MLNADHPVVSGLLVPLVARSFLVFGVLAFVVGIGMLVDARRMRRVFTLANRWISARPFFQRAEVPHDVDGLLTRRRHWFSAIVIGGALYSLFGLVAVFDLDSFMTFANAHARHRAFAWGVQMFWWALVIGNIVALLAGLMELVCPALLERLSRVANRWITPPRLVPESADKMNLALDSWVERFPRFSGAAISVGALMVVIQFARLLSGH